jgi:UV DNA damage repair endonuclease
LFTQNIKRIGFACKIQDENGKALPGLNTSTTTLTWLDNQPKQKAVDRLWEIMQRNVKVLQQQMLWLAVQKPEHKMFRLTSDILPAYTHDNWLWFYFEPDVQRYLERELLAVGDLARQHDIRLSFHPGQFCVLASDSDNIVENSVAEFEYHCDLIRYMGFGKQFQDFKCNVHISGKQGPQGIKRALKKLSKEARNCLTIENAEFSWGLGASLELVADCALVLDIHHHWIMTGEYIEPTDPRIQGVIESWRGVRPAMHYSVSREDVLVDHCAETKPDLEVLRGMGFTKAKMRAHSEFYWNRACNQWAKSHGVWADIMCEAKQKNLAAHQL